MKRSKWSSICLLAVILSAILSSGCDDLARRSIRDGIFVYISGSVSQGLDGNFTQVLGDLLTGGLFGTAPSSNSGTP
ncbi:MAG: hypothetical protein AMXMBFR13_00420 [Phycisphaerae bacterium]|jgi:hypothetical protein